MSDILKALRENKEFQAVMDDALKHRTIVPSFSICKTKDEQEMVIESIKYMTAMQNGFDFLFQYLTGKSPSSLNVKELRNARRTADD